MIMILFYVAIGGLILATILLAIEHQRIRRSKRRRGAEAEPTALDEVRELRQLGATIDAQASDLNRRLATLEKTLAATRASAPRATPEPVAPRSA